jgi:hypothetical protein
MFLQVEKQVADEERSLANSFSSALQQLTRVFKQ